MYAAARVRAIKNRYGPKGAVYAVTGKEGSWYRIIYSGRTGYIYAKYLSVCAADQETIIEGYYASKAAYDGYGPEDIPADKLDVVAYTFVAIDNGLYRKFSSSEDMAYDDIISSHLGTLKRYWNSKAGVPWLYGGSVFVSYGDPQSIALKAAFIKQNGLMGAGIWELSQNADGTLLRKLRDNIE